MDISQQQIWIVESDFLVHPSSTTRIERVEYGMKPKKQRKLLMEKGEYIEMRFETPWHFRTEDDSYFQATEDTLLKHCKYIGKVWERVAWENKAKLHEILRLKLYDEPKVEAAEL